MIEIGSRAIDLADPLVWVGGGGLMLVLLLLALSAVRAGQAARSTGPLARQVAVLNAHVSQLSGGQQQLAGGLSQVAEAQAAGQTAMLQHLETRLQDVTAQMGESLQGSATRTAKSLGDLQQRLETIDRAQAKIETLSGNVLGLQDILANKQTRGAFGEIQLQDIVAKALPRDSFRWQETLSNGKRVDCLIDLPFPPGPIGIDAKFPLEAYEALRAAKDPQAELEAQRALRAAVKRHVQDISQKYILDGETADGALMFLPSEAVYTELHANFGDVVRAGFDARVWIVSPTTLMATLNTLRAVLKDARMREHAASIRATLRQVHRDVELVVERVGKLETHFDHARRDLDGVGMAAERAGKRAAKLESFDFGSEGVPEDDRVVSLPGRDGTTLYANQ